MRDNSRHEFFAHMPIIRDILYSAAARGALLSSMCAELDIEPRNLAQSDKRVSFHDACNAWRIAVRDTKDPLLGLHAGERATPAILGMVGYLMHNSATLLDSFRQVERFADVATNMLDYRMIVGQSTVKLQFIPSPVWMKMDPGTAVHAVDQAMAGTLNVFYLLSGIRVVPQEATFTRRSARGRTEYERVFQSPLRFNGTVNQLTFKKKQLETPVMTHDRSLLAVFEKMLISNRSRLTGKKTRHQVVHLIMGEFQGQLPSIDSVAAHMNLTPRSLQRRLKLESTSFREIVASAGLHTASILLKSRDIRVKEVAAMLGYSDVRAFRAAYRSWTGSSPRRSKMLH